MAAKILTKSEFARHRGVRPSAVGNWIRRGHLKAPAITEDGKIDVKLADEQISGVVDPIRAARAKTRVPDRPVPRAARQHAKAARTGRKPLPPPPPSAADQAGAQLLQARALMATVEAERKRRELELDRGRYTLAAEAEAAWARALTGFLVDVEQSLADLAATLALDQQQRVQLRRWWRNRRLAAADKNRLAAAEAPQLVEDTAA